MPERRSQRLDEDAPLELVSAAPVLGLPEAPEELESVEEGLVVVLVLPELTAGGVPICEPVLPEELPLAPLLVEGSLDMLPPAPTLEPDEPVLLEVCAIEAAETPRRAAATAALSTLTIIKFAP